MKKLKIIFIIVAIFTAICSLIFGQNYTYPNIPKNIYNNFTFDFYLDKNLIQKNHLYLSCFDENILRLKSENGTVIYGIIQRNYTNEKPQYQQYTSLYKYGDKYVEEWIRIIPLDGFRSMFGEKSKEIYSGNFIVTEYFDFEDKRMYKYLYTLADILDKLQLKTITDFKQSFTNKWHMEYTNWYKKYTNEIYFKKIFNDYSNRIITNSSGYFRGYNGYYIKMDWDVDDSGRKLKIIKRDLLYENNPLIYTNIVYLNYTNHKGKIKTKKVKLDKEFGIYYSELENKYLNLYDHDFYKYFYRNNHYRVDLQHNFIEIKNNDVDKIFVSRMRDMCYWINDMRYDNIWWFLSAISGEAADIDIMRYYNSWQFLSDLMIKYKEPE